MSNINTTEQTKTPEVPEGYVDIQHHNKNMRAQRTIIVSLDAFDYL